jgi:hypothetical protein
MRANSLCPPLSLPTPFPFLPGHLLPLSASLRDIFYSLLNCRRPAPPSPSPTPPCTHSSSAHFVPAQTQSTPHGPFASRACRTRGAGTIGRTPVARTAAWSSTSSTASRSSPNAGRVAGSGRTANKLGPQSRLRWTQPRRCRRRLQEAAVGLGSCTGRAAFPSLPIQTRHLF